MDLNLISAIVLIILLTFFVWKNRRRVKVQKILFPFLYIIMFKSEKGLDKMDRIARKHPVCSRFLGYTGIVVGFAGMLLIGVELVLNTINLFLKPETAAGIQPVLPFEAKGVFFVPFIYWIITIFIVAIVHEFAHGIIARSHKIPLKSTGFAFFCLFIPILPAAFVEPDEESLRLRRKREQLSVLAAGSFANILVALFSLVLLIVSSGLVSAAFEKQGIIIKDITKDGPAGVAGMVKGENIMFVGNVRVNSTDDFMRELGLLGSGSEVRIKTEDNIYDVVLGESPFNKSVGFLGVKIEQEIVPKKDFVAKYGSFTPSVVKSGYTLFSWIFLLNLGIGLFNLLPIVPLDGGRMLKLVLEGKKIGLKMFKFIAFFFLLLILINLFAGFLF